jgi:hypothetical protein
LAKSTHGHSEGGGGKGALAPGPAKNSMFLDFFTKKVCFLAKNMFLPLPAKFLPPPLEKLLCLKDITMLNPSFQQNYESIILVDLI